MVKKENFDPWEEETNVYKDEVRSQLVDDDAMTPEEEGFMKGYDEDSDEEETQDEEEFEGM